jgi:hypothetical protein
MGNWHFLLNIAATQLCLKIPSGASCLDIVPIYVGMHHISHPGARFPFLTRFQYELDPCFPFLPSLALWTEYPSAYHKKSAIHFAPLSDSLLGPPGWSMRRLASHLHTEQSKQKGHTTHNLSFWGRTHTLRVFSASPGHQAKPRGFRIAPTSKMGDE